VKHLPEHVLLSWQIVDSIRFQRFNHCTSWLCAASDRAIFEDSQNYRNTKKSIPQQAAYKQQKSKQHANEQDGELHYNYG
jgi:hypothetical protein